MKVVQINTVYGKGSTGRIVQNIQAKSLSQNIENIVAYRYCEGNSVDNTYCVSTWTDCHVHNRIARYTHRAGFYSYIRTALFLRYLDKVKPDILHLHNLHGSYVNVKLLFEYIRKNNIKVIWTFHDCWPFTGYCPYFEIFKCNNWESGCKNCCRATSIWNRHNAEKNLCIKKAMTAGIEMTVVAPSNWLADYIRQSIYTDFPVVVIPNGIDLEIFRPRQSDFRRKYNISESHFVLLGVASVWEARKGLDVFMELSQKLDNRFVIVLVGTNENDDKELSKKIISIHRTDSQKELAEIYTAADVFVNPTREEVFGLVNVEALACGTPGITFNTGGSPECYDDTCGSVVDCGDVDAMKNEIIRICEQKPFKAEDCIEHAKRFDMNDRFREYVDLYKSLCT